VKFPQLPSLVLWSRVVEPFFGACEVDVQVIANTTRNRVFRCSLSGPQASTRVIVKQLVREPDAERFFTNGASLQFLSERTTTR
jgi:hypothetical protein